jgi:hypothetical protein
MGSNNFDGKILLDTETDYIGWGRTQGTDVSTGPRIYAGYANLAALSGTLTAPIGSICLLDTGEIAINTSGTTTWAIVGVSRRAITDPGNAGAIPVTYSGYCPIVTAGAETRTLAAPSHAGQELLLYMKTDGGNAVITAAAAINAAGNNTITFADVTDSLLLRAVESGGSLVWRVVSSDGAALSTV